MALAHEDSPVYVAGGASVLSALYLDKDKLVKAFRGDGAVAWGDHHPCMFSGTEKFFRPGYRANLTSSWLPALDGVVAKLEAGAKVADVGCGHGASTVVMAQAYPKSRFFGFDYHQPSIDTSKQRAAEAGVGDRATFVQAAAKSYTEKDFDLICFFDCLHDMGDPVGAARHAFQALKPGGTVLLVEPFANDKLDQNLNPVGRMFYAASTFICTPNSLSQEVGLGLGAQAGEARRPSSARPTRSRRRSAWASARRRARRGCAASSWRRASSSSGARPRRRSTSSSRPGSSSEARRAAHRGAIRS
jgi:SAM-dependent methyltransferase